MSQNCQNHQEARLVLRCGSTLTPTIMLTANGRGADKCAPEMEITALLKYVSTSTNTVQNSKALIKSVRQTAKTLKTRSQFQDFAKDSLFHPRTNLKELLSVQKNKYGN